MRTAVFGGSFDPIHVGHLHVADEVLTNLRYERVLFVVARRNPLKVQGPSASDEDRVEMVRRAVAGHSGFEVNTDELKRDGPSYTMDTIDLLIGNGTAQNPVGLIVGDDLLEQLEKWKRVDELKKTVRLIIAGRRRQYPEVADSGWTGWERIHNTLLDVSSSDIRERVQSGTAYRYLIHEQVYQYIKQHGLYRS